MVAEQIIAQGDGEHEYDEAATFKVLKKFFDQMGWEITEWNDQTNVLKIDVNMTKMMENHLKDFEKVLPRELNLVNWFWSHHKGTAHIEVATESY
jgi:hypothetical protein